MKKLNLLIVGITLACSALSSYAEIKDPIENRLYPRFGSSWVGDTMPFNNDGEMQIFYLNDARFGSEAFHPWHRSSTKNFTSYTDHGEALAVVEDLQSQELALGTGSVIKVGNTFHAFYTGHNKHLDPHEAILHATSNDMKTWTKHPEEMFFAPDAYEKNDFRDPHVIYMEDLHEYWMLITARQRGKGVIAKFVSKDLKTWKDTGVFFKNDTEAKDSNLECPTLIKYGDFWYLSFSDQWPNRVTQYRISDNPAGPFKKPAFPAIDGRGFYAGKLEQMNGQLYAAGWAGSKQLFKDSGDFAWAGNLVVHQLKQAKDGQLYTTAPETVAQSFPEGKSPQVTSTTTTTGDALKFKKGEYQTTSFGKIEGITKIEGEIQTSGWFNQQFGIAFNMIRDRGRLNIVFDKSKDKVFFYNVPLDRIADTEPQIVINHDIKDNTKFSIYIDDSVMVMYIDDEIAMSTRMYRMQGRTWGVFSNGSNVEFSGLKISHK
ncbi:MAG: DUF4975 domain-containing protein [Psychromonas sp.]|nr:DUF4975 domain-containing protein [Psychromonas sp.]